MASRRRSGKARATVRDDYLGPQEIFNLGKERHLKVINDDTEEKTKKIDR
jgi:hypothetical protein